MKLEKKVHAVNETNRIIKLNFDHIMPQLQAFIGEKIILASGSKSAKFKDAIKYVEAQPKKFGEDYASLQRVYLDFSYKSIWLKVSCCFKDNEYSCFYQEDSIFIGELAQDGMHLESLRTASCELVQYEANEVRKELERKKELEAEISRIKTKMFHFTDGFFS